MANRAMIARLATFPEFVELREYWAEQGEEAVKKLARKSFAQPAEHDVLDWERLRAFHQGVEAALDLPKKFGRKPDAAEA